VNEDYLSDYQAHEFEALEVFARKVERGDFDLDEGFPSKRRFHRLNNPFALATQVESSIWPQIPLCGSLLITLVPRRREQFAAAHGFEVKDIDRLVDFARDTGRVQFGLNTDPIHYIGLDFLEPIFTEMKPPLMQVIPYDRLLDKQVLRKYEIEFLTLAEINFIPKFMNIMRQNVAGISMEYIKKRIEDFQRDFVVLKACGYEEITNRMADALVSDFSETIRLFMVYGNFISEPSLFPLKIIHNRSLDEIQEALREGAVQQERISLPTEIGQFLLRKTSLFPESFQACLDVVSKYKQEELDKVFSALNEALRQQNIDLVKSKSEDLSVILENVWNDAERLSKTSTLLRWGIPLHLAAIGATIGMMGGLLGAATGFLTGLGFGVSQEAIKVGIGPLSEKIAKFGQPHYISSIFNFKKKIKIR
jgi:hypothetical protein